VADGSDVHARRETLNGRKKVCVRVGSDNAPFESGPATVADSLCQEREQGCEGISEPLRIGASCKVLSTRLKSGPTSAGAGVFGLAPFFFDTGPYWGLLEMLSTSPIKIKVSLEKKLLRW
jgi:hypothetical protein